MEPVCLPQPVEFPVHTGEETCHPLSRGDFTRILRPRAFFWYRNKLFVGYNWLSSLHINEEPVWDPKPVLVGTRIEDCNGFIDFVEIRREGPPYYRGYAMLRLTYRYRPNDTGSGNPVLGGWGEAKKLDQGTVAIDEQYMLFPNCFMQLSWSNTFDPGELLAPGQIDDWKADRTQDDAHWESCKIARTMDEPDPPFPKRKHWGFYTPEICMCHKWLGDGENRLRRILRSPCLDTMRYDKRAVAIRKREHPNGCLLCH
jgi:hypothetical protein